jgi:predicted amidohydrolase
MPSGSVTLACVQVPSLVGRKGETQDQAERLMREAVRAGAQVLMTPEVAFTGFTGGESERAAAEPIPGPTTRRFAALARELGVHLLVGLSELRDGHLHNAMAVIAPDGALLGVMRKVHINKFEVPGGWRNGSDFPVWRLRTATGEFTAGVMICYDREPPESARLLMLAGADVIFNPLACGCPTDDIHRCLLRVRAFENEVVLAMCNQAAPSQNGHSMLIDHHGVIRAEAGDQPGFILHRVDLDALARERQAGIYGRHHRRPELYGPLGDAAGQLHPPEANLPPRPLRSA